MRSFEPPSPMPVRPTSVSTVTSIALWLKLRFMLGCSQHFTRVTVALGRAASARVGRTSPAAMPPAPTASDLKSDRRFIMVAPSLGREVIPDLRMTPDDVTAHEIVSQPWWEADRFIGS